MSVYSRTNVTAVKLCSDHILTGIGSYIHVFDKESTKLIQKIHCLNCQKIYGFVPDKNGKNILVFGGKQFTIVTKEGELYTTMFEPVVCDDWLHSGVWMEGDAIALLTAHNVVQKWHWHAPPALMSSHPSRDNSVLYSGLLVPLADDDVLVFAGTVFSEVIVHCADEVLHGMTGHRGVIFSISCDPRKETIVTTSDDRSVRIWKINNIQKHPNNTRRYWKDSEIKCLHEVYGHSARVMRSCITDGAIISVGEDSAICFWDDEGKLLRKIVAHQNSSIWSVDADDEALVTGGGDCGVNLHPMALAKEYGQNNVLDIDAGTPKKILLTARTNVIVLNDSNELIYYDVKEKSRMVYKLNHDSTYKMISLSSCKQIVAVADMNCKLDIFTENCKNQAYLQNAIDVKLQIGKVMSMHWAGNRHLIFCSDNGNITALAQNGNKTDVSANYALPPCKERWLTATAINSNNRILVVGDRCGNIHVYALGLKNPIKTFSKVHGRYGPTTISIKENSIISTGRDGTIKQFSFNDEMTKFIFLNTKEMEFNWVEKFLDKNESLVCGFQERLFVVHNLTTNTKLLETQCGGGHRSWDVVRYFEKINGEYEECIELIYIKNSDIHSSVFQLSKIVSKNIVNGSHSKEINCLKTFKSDMDESKIFYISGGEDTTLRISSLDRESYFQDEIIMKHLSSVRSLKIIQLNDKRMLLISAGGRAQICVKIITLEKTNNGIKLLNQDLVNHMVKGTDKERKGNQTWRDCTIDFDPETRIMDLDFMKVDDENFIIFTGCSDACIRIFVLSLDPKQVLFKPIKEIEHHKTCILKTKFIKLSDKHIFISCTTRGEITFWETNIKNNDKQTFEIDAIFSTTTNISGINGLDSRILPDSRLIIATAGDDNAVHLNILEVANGCHSGSLKVAHKWQTDKLHSSQITGVILLDDVLITTSIDQRVTLCSWRVLEEGISCQYLKQVLSDIADIHGMELLEYCRNSVTVCVYGKGMEVITLPVTDT